MEVEIFAPKESAPRCGGCGRKPVSLLAGLLCAHTLFPLLSSAGRLRGTVRAQHAASVRLLLAVSEGAAQFGAGGSLHQLGGLPGPQVKPAGLPQINMQEVH